MYTAGTYCKVTKRINDLATFGTLYTHGTFIKLKYYGIGSWIDRIISNDYGNICFSRKYLCL